MTNKIRVHGIIWDCAMCGAANLSERNWKDFVCVNCGSIIYALAEEIIEEIKKPKKKGIKNE